MLATPKVNCAVVSIAIFDVRQRVCPLSSTHIHSQPPAPTMLLGKFFISTHGHDVDRYLQPKVKHKFYRERTLRYVDTYR